MCPWSLCKCLHSSLMCCNCVVFHKTVFIIFMLSLMDRCRCSLPGDTHMHLSANHAMVILITEKTQTYLTPMEHVGHSISTWLTCVAHPFQSFSCFVAGIDNIWWSWKFQLLTTFRLFATAISISGFLAPNTRRDTSRHGRPLLEPWAKFNDKTPRMVQNTVSRVIFCCRIQIWHQKALNLLLFETIGPKNATLFIRGQLWVIITPNGK